MRNYWTATVIMTTFLLVFASCRKEAPIIIGDPNLIDASEIIASPIKVIQNPFEIAPLSATLFFNTFQKVKVETNIVGANYLNHEFDTLSLTHQIPILGMLPATRNEIVLKYTTAEGLYALDTVFIMTPSLPDFLPEINVKAYDINRAEPGLTLIEYTTTTSEGQITCPIMFDEKGRIRWFMDLSFTNGWTAPVQKSANGNLLFARGFAIYEYNFLGQEIDRWSFFGYWQHHDLIELPNGNFIIPVSNSNSTNVNDQLIEIDRSSKELVREWDFKDILDTDRLELTKDPSDWLHINSVWYDERDGGLVISSRHQGVFKISADHDLEWIISPHKGWGLAGEDNSGHRTSEFLLKAVDIVAQQLPGSMQQGTRESPHFSWPWGQHAAMVLPNGNIFTYNNGWNRLFTSNNSKQSQAIEYTLDLEARNIRQVWQYGKEKGEEFYSPNTSDVDFLPTTENRLITSGNIHTATFKGAKLIEVAENGDIIMETDIRFKAQPINGIYLPGQEQVYRSERLRFFE